MSVFEPIRDGRHPITPAQLAQEVRNKLHYNKKNGLQVDNPLHGSIFKNHYAEVGTAYLIIFCDERGKAWQPLTAAELEEGTKNILLEPYNPFNTGETCASFLIDNHWIVREGEIWEDSQFFFTSELITVCLDALTK